MLRLCKNIVTTKNLIGTTPINSVNMPAEIFEEFTKEQSSKTNYTVVGSPTIDGTKLTKTTVNVTGNDKQSGDFIYTPLNFTATVGDTVEFNFKMHTPVEFTDLGKYAYAKMLLFGRLQYTPNNNATAWFVKVDNSNKLQYSNLYSYATITAPEALLPDTDYYVRLLFDNLKENNESLYCDAHLSYSTDNADWKTTSWETTALYSNYNNPLIATFNQNFGIGYAQPGGSAATYTQSYTTYLDSVNVKKNNEIIWKAVG